MNDAIPRGIIVSIQGYHYKTMTELAKDAINAGCVAIRTDKRLCLSDEEKVPIIGLKKLQVEDVKAAAYITPTPEEVQEIESWADLVAVDYRACNENLQRTSKYCRERALKVVADIETYDDFANIRDRGYYYTYVATTLSVFKLLFRPNLRLVEKIAQEEKHVIAEGNFSSRKDVRAAFEYGAHAVCIGSAISNVYKLTKKYTSVPMGAL